MDAKWQIPRPALIWVLICVCLVLAPQILRMPYWISLIALTCIAWRVAIHLGRLDFPNRIVRAAAVVFTLLVSAGQIRNLGIGLDSAASLLALGFVFKLIEMRHKRDVYVMLSLCFVMCLVAFIYSQSVVTTIYVLLCVIATLAAMVALNRSPQHADTASTLGLAVKISLQSIPLMLVLFMVFPRIAPLWAVPVQTSANRTGVSDEMTPGDISRLVSSADLAFRVGFEGGTAPAHQNLYWRGLVLEEFDGTTWRRRSNAFYSMAAARSNYQQDYAGRVVLRGEPISYHIILEPTQRPWLYGLQLAEPASTSVYRGRNFELFYSTLVSQRLSYDINSYLEGQTDVFLRDSIRRSALELPGEGNERSRAFALQLREQYRTERDYIYAVLAYFQQQPFFYTLSPAPLQGDHIDDFLFNTREGFCEHYASSFTYLMRAAGIPARVVIGYQGAEYNRYENYLMVYQYNAHAWSEVWLEGEGWVRFDPTGAVSPDRINLGVEAALQNDPAFLNDSLFSMARWRGFNLFNTLRLRLDAIEYEWNRRVVSYDQDVQFQLFERLFGEVTERKVLLLMGTLGTIVIVLVGLTVIRTRPDQPRRPVEVLYLKACRDLARAGYPRRRGEGPQTYQRRIQASLETLSPQLAVQFAAVNDMYLRLNYMSTTADAAAQRRYLNTFRKRLLRLRLKLAPRFGRAV